VVPQVVVSDPFSLFASPQAEGLQHQTLGHRPKKSPQEIPKKFPKNLQAEGLKQQFQGNRPGSIPKIFGII